jgi:predicted dehydrogenase
MKTYRVGILGFGFIGKVHAYGYRNLSLFYDPIPLKATVSHICTRRLETAEKAKAMLDADAAVTDYREITENPEIDIVHICTPNYLHREALLSAMRHQKHLYCDKPLTATVAEAEEIEAALPSYRGIAQMTFQYRFYPSTMRAKQLMESGSLGQLLGFRVAYLHGGNADPRSPAKWKLTSAAGGGVIADLGSHVLDIVDWLIGPLRSVTAATQIAYPTRPSLDDSAKDISVDAEDSVVVLARTASGAMGTLEATKIATGSEDELRFEIHGSRGALRFNGMDPHHLEWYDVGASDRPLGGSRGWTRIDVGQRYPSPASGFPTAKAPIGWLRSHAACLANFLQAIAENRPADPDLRQGVRVQRLMDCTCRSADQGCWMDV